MMNKKEAELILRKKCQTWIDLGRKLDQDFSWDINFINGEEYVSNGYHTNKDILDGKIGINPLQVLILGEKLIGVGITETIKTNYGIDFEYFYKGYKDGLCEVYPNYSNYSHSDYENGFNLARDYFLGKRLYKKCKLCGKKD